ncbi:L-type lectin-domain containing receptor kinase IX.1-like [Oryza brachyantha]|uniref:non-specific serine/threonine protein kinase n=1 Tax=Oryza brachyantha TaxID=4533 RepID=J3MPZ5_ORYBR|nr:L-type lectin-domain containing receptor kinase IX.1-like [Oryza brachyantha]
MAGFSVLTSASTTTTTCVVGLMLLAVCYEPVAALSFNYSNFGPDEQKNIRLEGDAAFSADVSFSGDGGGWIDISANRLDGSIAHSRGRASYALPIPLWDRDTGEVASFTTRFSFDIYPPPPAGINNKGAGMAFFLACYPSRLPSAGSYAYNLGLTNQTADQVAAGDDRFVAVEFDTFNDTIVHDPHDTYDHLGIDVNSVVSKKTLTLPSFSIVGNMTAVVEYDNVTSILAMQLQLGYGLSGPRHRPPYNLSYKVDLKSVLPEQVSIGFSAATSTSVELHQLRSWYFSSSLEPKVASPSPSPSPPSPTSATSSGVVAGATVGAAVFAVLLFAMVAAVLVRRRRIKKMREAEDDDDDSEGDPIMEIENGTGPRRFPYHKLVSATKSFAAEEKLGQGGFGAVYRGYLREQGLAVAIKRFIKNSSKQGRTEYKSEIKVISRLRHRNLVQLIGWCHGRSELLLVYELVPNGSLDAHLYGNGTFLTWPMRINIVLGLGSALLYLHEEWEQCVVHRDIKPSNVMLDESFNAKLGDFGLARLIDHAVGIQTMTHPSGTPGYVDPECVITGKASAESDVYSFGVVLLEVACGRRPMSLLDDQNNGLFRLVEWAWDLYGRGAALMAADKRLDDDYDKAEMERVIAVGLWCAHPDRCARPSIRAAMAVLQANGALPVLPAKMPVPIYAPPPPVTSSEGQLSSSTGMSSSSLTQTAISPR